MLKRPFAALIAALALTLAVAGCELAAPSDTASAGPSGQPDIVSVIRSDANLATMMIALNDAGLDQKLSGPGPFTLFAPSNKAFSLLPVGMPQHLLDPANKAELVRLLNGHIARGRVASGQQTTLTSLAGTALQINGQSVNGARFVGHDIVASNGVIHIVDAVLRP